MALPFPPHENLAGEEAAALISVGIGIFALGCVTPIGAWLVTVEILPCEATRPLLTLLAILLWVGSWLSLRRRWRGHSARAKTVVLTMSALIVLGLISGSPLLALLWRGIMLP